MDNTFDYINIREVLSRVTRNKLLKKNVTLEAVVQYTLDFIRIVGLKQPKQTKETIIHVHEYRALLPCDLVEINQIKDTKSNLCLRAMSSTFNPKGCHNLPELTYKVQNKVLFCGLKECDLEISYQAIAVDEQGFPLLLNDELWLSALELYIKQLVYSDLFDYGEINQASLQNAQQQYSWRVGQLINRYSIPTVDQMESIKNMWLSPFQDITLHSTGFKTLATGNELIKH